MAGAVRLAARRGLIIGGCAVYFLVIGMFERFSGRNVITDLTTLGWVLLALLLTAAGAWAARGMREEQTPRALGSTALAGVVAGALAGALPGLFLLVAAVVNLRRMFVRVTPTLVDLLSVGDSTLGGALRLILLGTLLGAAGALVGRIPARIRRPLVVGAAAVLLISLLEPLLRVALANLRLKTSWLYRSGGLTLLGALLVLVVAVAAAVAQDWQRGRVATAQDAGTHKPVGRVVVWAVVGVVLLVLPQVVGSFLAEVAGTVGLYVLLGIGLNIVVGNAGLLHLGYVAFFAVGAYASAVLTSPASALGAELPFWGALPLVIVFTAIVGLFVGAPVLRLRGDYLAIVTLAFGEIARILALSDWLRPWLGGAQGILSIPAPTLGGLRFRDPEMLYYLILLACAVTAFISWRLEDSRVGRAWTAMREDEQVAQIMGINISRYKLLAFALGAGIGSISGAFFAVKIGSVFPHSFSILVSITALSVVILGGIGSLRGVVLGAAVLVGLPDLLREFGEYRLLIYGALLVAIMILRPQGLLPNVRRERELGDEERQQDQWLRRTGGDDPEPVITGGTADA